MTLLLLTLLGIAAVALGWSARREHRLRLDTMERHERELRELQRRHAAALRESSLHLGTLLDRMIEGLIVIDADGCIRLANRAAAALFGFDPPATGRTLLEAVRHHEVAGVVVRLKSEREVDRKSTRLNSSH